MSFPGLWAGRAEGLTGTKLSDNLLVIGSEIALEKLIRIKPRQEFILLSGAFFCSSVLFLSQSTDTRISLALGVVSLSSSHATVSFRHLLSFLIIPELWAKSRHTLTRLSISMAPLFGGVRMILARNLPSIRPLTRWISFSPWAWAIQLIYSGLR